MNGAVYDTQHVLQAALREGVRRHAHHADVAGDISIGELCWALSRGALYAPGFLAVMLRSGLSSRRSGSSPSRRRMLIGFAFASVGMAATSFMRSWQDFDLIQLVDRCRMFLFSGTFFPIDAYPEALRMLIEISPLYRGVDLLRSLSLGIVGPSIVVDIVYLGVMGALGLLVVSRRLDKLLLR